MIDHVVAFTSVCGEDAHWVAQYLAEMERIGLRFAIHFDRFPQGNKLKIQEHPLCVGATHQNDLQKEFHQRHKQGVFDLACKHAPWVMAHDIDETFEEDAVQNLVQLKELQRHIFAASVKVDTLWNDTEHVRVDGPFCNARRIRCFRSGAADWRFEKYCKPQPYRGGRRKGGYAYLPIDLTVLHWGLMTREGRELHKRRWDRVYNHILGNNPYEIWNYACDERIKPEIERRATAVLP